VDVRPDFKLPDYNGLSTEIALVERPTPEVDTVIEGLRAERADFKGRRARRRQERLRALRLHGHTRRQAAGRRRG